MNGHPEQRLPNTLSLSIRGAVYYPPSEILARRMGCIEGAYARLGSSGAAFIAVRATKK